CPSWDSSAMLTEVVNSSLAVGMRTGSTEPREAFLMKLEGITLREIQMPLVHFFETSFGRTTSRRILLVTVHSEGVNGWAECVASENPFYSDEWIDTAWLTIRSFLAPALIGKVVSHGRECPSLMAQVRGHRMAKAALENAVWDAEAKQRNVPLWKLLGGNRREIPCGVSIGIQDSVEQLLDNRILNADGNTARDFAPVPSQQLPQRHIPLLRFGIPHGVFECGLRHPVSTNLSHQ